MNRPTATSIQVIKPQLFKRHYQFMVDNDVIAELIYPRAYGKTAGAIIKNKKWQVRKGGFWKHYIEFIADQSPYTKEKIEFGWNFNLKMTSGDGKTYHLKKTSFWKNVWSWLDESNQPVIEMKSNKLSRKNRGNVTFHQPQKTELTLLMLIGWFMIVSYEDATAAAGAG